jgi:hypothetical protein
LKHAGQRQHIAHNINKARCRARGVHASVHKRVLYQMTTASESGRPDEQV